MVKDEIIKEIISAFGRRDPKRLRRLQDLVLEDASIINSKKLFHLAIMTYVLSKVLSKPRFAQPVYRERMLGIASYLGELDSILKTSTEEQFDKKAQDFSILIGKLESDDPRFVISLIAKGKLKVAATLYAQGISLGVASEITGVEKQEVLSYAGHTMMFDRLKEEKKVGDRLRSLKNFVEG